MNDLLILAALLRGPAYGYALKRTARLIFGGGDLHGNVVYPSLRKFLRNGWVRKTSEPGARGQDRKQYWLTAAGREYLLDQLGVFGKREAADEGAFLLRLAFFDVLPKGKREVILAQRKSFLTSRAREFSQLRRATPPKSFSAVALGRVEALVKNELRWISGVEGQLKTKRGVL